LLPRHYDSGAGQRPAAAANAHAAEAFERMRGEAFGRWSPADQYFIAAEPLVRGFIDQGPGQA
jgi:hypothetical protein